MDLPQSSGDETGVIDAVMVVGSQKRFIPKNIEVGVFSPLSFNKGKTSEQTEFELAIQESLEFDQSSREFDEGNCLNNSSSSCTTVVQRTANVTSNPVDFVEVTCLMWILLCIILPVY